MGKLGEKLAITIYLVLSIAFEVLYWLVPNFMASSVFVALLGFFLGSLFPAAIVAATKLLPADFHASAIGFAVAFGRGGAAVSPFAIRAIAQKSGVEALRSIIMAILLFIILIWLVLPGELRRGGLEQARENHKGTGHEVRLGYRWLKSKPTSRDKSQ